MGDVVNLRQRRKAADRANREAEAAANRAKFGRSKAEKQAARAEAALEARRFEGHRLGAPEDGEK